MADYRPVYASAMVAVYDWACAGSDRARRRPSEPVLETIAFVRGGVFRKHVGRREIVATAGSALFFPAGEPYATTHPTGHGDRGTAVQVPPAVLEEARERSGRSDRDRPRGAVLPAPALLRLQRLTRAVGAPGDLPALDIEEDALLLIGEALACADAAGRPAGGGRAPSRTHRRAVEQVKQIAAARYAERLLIADFADQVAYSPYHLCRVFRRLTGTTIHRFLNRLRLAIALESLAPDSDLGRIALEVGFYSHSHFTNAFRREFGVPPSRLRRSIDPGLIAH